MARPVNGNFNEHTGSGLVTKAATSDYLSGWDLIWGNKKKEEDSVDLEEHSSEEPSTVVLEDEASSQ
jgi:hypothetical protein